MPPDGRVASLTQGALRNRGLYMKPLPGLESEIPELKVDP
jgi:hypothetical protein